MVKLINLNLKYIFNEKSERLHYFNKWVSSKSKKKFIRKEVYIIMKKDSIF